MQTTNLSKPILIIDIETTGLSPKNDFLIDIGIVELCPQTREITPLFNSLVREDGFSDTLRKKLYMIHKNNFSVEEILTAPTLESLKPALQEIFDRHSGRITAWNRQFDYSFLANRGFDWGEEFPCPMRESVSFFKLPFAQKSQNQKNGYKVPKVQEAWDILFPHDPQNEEHKGLPDAIMEAKIINELIRLNGLNW